MGMLSKLTISGILMQYPDAAKVLERYHVDYCCNGQSTLEEVCEVNSDTYFRILRDLHRLQVLSFRKGVADNPADYSPGELCDFIVEKHHGYIKSVLPALLVHAFQVSARFKSKFPELEEIKNCLTGINAEFDHHLMKEEEIIFPRIKQLEHALQEGADPEVNYKMIVDPLKVILKEHDHADETFLKIRRLSNNYTLPLSTDKLFELYFKQLKSFEEDLHVHVHLENNILFPKVRQMIAQLKY